MRIAAGLLLRPRQFKTTPSLKDSLGNIATSVKDNDAESRLPPTPFIFLHTPTTLESAALRDYSFNWKRENKI